MKNSYIKRFKIINEIIKSNEIQSKAHLGNQNTFTRKRKMPLKDMVLCTLSKKGLTTAMELNQYFKQKDCADMNISKQGYLQQRKKLNPEVFSYLNREYLKDFYNSKEPSLWNRYLVLAIDGRSKAEIPNSEENQRVFGKSGNHHTEGPARVLVSGMLDVFNSFFLDIQLGNITTSESELAKENIKAVKRFIQDYPILVIFDRGYPSIELIDFLEENHVMYLFRLSSNDYIKERGQMCGNDELVELKHTCERIGKIRKKHPEIADKLKAKRVSKTRILIGRLESGNELILMTNLPKEHRKEGIEGLYFKRWEIEKKYHTLKNKMKFESVTGKATIYVYQDFWAQLLI